MFKKNSTGSDSVRTKRYKKATVYLVLQCVLLLEAIALLLTERSTKTHQYENGVEQFRKTIKDLHAEVQKCLKSRNVLEIAKNKMAIQNQRLKEEEKLLSKHLRKMDGWKCFQSGLYYISPTKKNWTDSKQDCLKRGANLTIINSNEEQDFFKHYDEVWIGLTNVKGTWTWIDDSALTFGFWKPGEANGHEGTSCAATTSSGWRKYSCNEAFQWICER